MFLIGVRVLGPAYEQPGVKCARATQQLCWVRKHSMHLAVSLSLHCERCHDSGVRLVGAMGLAGESQVVRGALVVCQAAQCLLGCVQSCLAAFGLCCSLPCWWPGTHRTWALLLLVCVCSQPASASSLTNPTSACGVCLIAHVTLCVCHLFLCRCLSTSAAAGVCGACALHISVLTRRVLGYIGEQHMFVCACETAAAGYVYVSQGGVGSAMSASTHGLLGAVINWQQGQHT